jgi:AcrR family transcriptional regulator
MSEATTSDGPPADRGEALRADAQRNRDAILRAARQVFARQGYTAPLGTIAEAAGVGRATMQRRFPTREDLILALARQNMDDLQELADRTRGQADGYTGLLAEIARIVMRDRGFIDFFDQPDAPSSTLRNHIAQRLVQISAAPLDTAQQAGVVRADLRPADTVILVDMLTGPIKHANPYATVADTAQMALRLVLHAIAGS